MIPRVKWDIKTVQEAYSSSMLAGGDLDIIIIDTPGAQKNIMSDFKSVVDSKRKPARPPTVTRYSLRIPAQQHREYKKTSDDIGVSMNDL